MRHHPRTRFPGMEPSPGMQALVDQRMSELESMDSRISACTIVIQADKLDQPARWLHNACITIDLACVPARSSWRLDISARHENPYRAIIDCFRLARERLARLASSPLPENTVPGRSTARRMMSISHGDGAWRSRAAGHSPQRTRVTASLQDPRRSGSGDRGRLARVLDPVLEL